MHLNNLVPPAVDGSTFCNEVISSQWCPDPNGRDTYSAALSTMPVYLRDLVNAIAIKLDVDPGMTLSTLLSGMSAGLNGGKIVRRPDEGVEPLSLFTFILAGPTTGKTRTHNLVHAAHKAHDILRYKRTQKAKRGDATVAAIFDGSLPMVADTARLRSVIMQDTSNRGLLEALEGLNEFTAISVHEGQRVLGGTLFRRNLDTLNLLHDGEGQTTITRGKGDRVIAYNASLSSLVMVQPHIFGLYCLKYGQIARAIGFFPRCLFTTVNSFPNPIDRSLNDPDSCLKAYYDKVDAFLNRRLAQLEACETDPQVLAFSPRACQLWHSMVAEHRQLTNTVYWQVQDAANRAMQNVARVAGIIHSYDDLEGDIPEATLQCAMAVVKWNLSQFMDLFPPEPPPVLCPPKLTSQQKQLNREIEDGRVIVYWTSELCRVNQESAILRSRVFVRSALYNARFRTALMRLVDEGVVLESGEGKRTRLSVVPYQNSTETMRANQLPNYSPM